MKWEPNIVGYPISDWPRQAATPKPSATPLTEGVFVDRAHSATALASIMDLSDNIMLAHYQRDRS